MYMDSVYLEENHDEIYSGMRERGMNDGPALDRDAMVFQFFRPDSKFINWIKEYAGDRLIIDIGCGAGHITKMLHKAGAKVMGIDPYLNLDAAMDYQLEAMNSGLGSLHMLPWRVQQAGALFQSSMNILPMFCRPCHSDFVNEGIDMMQSGTEILYITKPNVIKDFKDLGEYDKFKVLVPHVGYSVDQEQVWSVTKP